MYRPIDPNRLVGRSVVVPDGEERRTGRIRAVGPAGVSVEVDGEAVLVPTEDVGRILPGSFDA